jgi:hypothetical protein
MDDVWGTVEEIVGWLDAGSELPPDTEKLLRIMKLTEEAGEVTQAVIGVMGANPRKGVAVEVPRARRWSGSRLWLLGGPETAPLAAPIRPSTATRQVGRSRPPGASLDRPAARA